MAKIKKKNEKKNKKIEEIKWHCLPNLCTYTLNNFMISETHWKRTKKLRKENVCVAIPKD